LKVSEFVRRQVLDRLDAHHIVVLYDALRSFDGLVSSFEDQGLTVISAVASTLQARRAADAWVRDFDAGVVPALRLLLYVPRPRRRAGEDQQTDDPFEVFARLGCAFGDMEAEQLESLACQALPTRAAEIRRLFGAGEPSLVTLDELDSGRRYPFLRQALGTDSPVEVAARVLRDPDTALQLATVPGSATEMWRLFEDVFAFAFGAPAVAGSVEIRRFATYVLFSEFTSDLPTKLPDALAGLTRATSVSHLDAVRALCDNLRSSDASREAYVDLASSIQSDLGLSAVIEELGDPGDRDTFPIEDTAALRRTIALIEAGDTASARRIVDIRRHSVWRSIAERGLRWKIAERALEFADTATAMERAPLGADATPRQHAAAYAAGGWELDRRQRLLEQVLAEAAAPEEFDSLTALLRQRYRALAGGVQDQFLDAVRRSGWPPEGLTHQTQVFERSVDRLLTDGRRVAFFLVDAMRYEMGRDLAAGLQDLGSSAVEPVATVVPTTTPAGMAALMPGAHGAWGLRRKNDSLVPAIGERQLAGAAERVAWLSERLGERYADIVFDDLIQLPVRALEARFAGRDLVVIRTQEIDALGEGGAGGLAARRIMSDVLSWLRQATNKLVQLGFRDFVFCADHGYVLLPEVAAGDVVTEPPGEWLLRKRRSRLGRAAGASPGVLVLSAPSLGIPGDVDDVAVPTGFRVYSRDAEFFHEGISLQECLVPLVTLLVGDQPIVTRQGGEHVEIIYKRDRFTSRIVGLKLRLDALLTPEVLVRVEAFDGSGAKAAKVGEAADCDARDERTGFIRLRRDEETQVPLRIEDDFRGRQVDVRVVNADGPEVVFGRLTLKNGMME
jgi:hypothetical protein